MPKKTITIDNIFGGHSPSFYFGESGTYQTSIAIDPDFPIDDSETGTGIKTGGILRPTATADFTGANLTEAPYWITVSPKSATNKVFTYLKNGRLISYNTDLSTEALIGTATSGAGNGMAYYNNYIYVATPTDISRYGPLDGSPALTNTVWTGATLGSQEALDNATYPNTRGSNALPNHAMHVHTDNKLYVCDFGVGKTTVTEEGKGLIHYIKTKKVTNEGDTDDGSTHNALDLPFGFLPTALESYGNLLVISAMQTTDATLNQGRSALFFWDTTSPSFNQIVYLPDPVVTALKNVNGKLYIWSGNFSNGCRLSVYLGGNSVSEVAFQEEGYPPMAGAVDGLGDRVYWGSFQTYPASSASVFAYGSKDRRFPTGLHSVFSTDSAGANQTVTSLKFAENANFIRPRPIIGWTDDTVAGGIDKISTTYGTCYWRSAMFNVGEKFRVDSIKLNFAAAVAANHTLDVTVYVDDGTRFTGDGTYEDLATINNTNYADSEREVKLYPKIAGRSNMFIELKWSGTALLPVLLPIKIDIETIEE